MKIYLVTIYYIWYVTIYGIVSIPTGNIAIGENHIIEKKFINYITFKTKWDFNESSIGLKCVPKALEESESISYNSSLLSVY